MNTMVKTHTLHVTPVENFIQVISIRNFWIVSLFVAAVFFSALGVVYVQDMNRMLYSQLQTLENTRDNLSVEWGQLLLEESTWATQARVAEVASENLGMSVPEQNNIVMVKD